MAEDEIIKSICKGGKALDAAVRALYSSAAQPMLRYFVYRGGISSDEAEDVLQETFIKIVRSAASFSGDGPAKAWIWQIARNCLNDLLRKKASVGVYQVTFDDDQWETLGQTAPAPVPCVPGVSVDECVSGGLDEFAKKMPDRAYVLTMQMDGLSIEEIGNQIGRTVAASKEYLSQCRKKLQPFIAHCTELLKA